MKKAVLWVIMAFSVLSGGAFIYAQNSKVNLSDKIKNNEAVVKGKLTNGITYYIRENKKPEKRAELRLVVNAGSILEDDDQQGLAHFCEHMAFNGTKNFKKQEIINFLEGIGMRFGPELNAYTSFDETVYMIQIPTDKKDILEKGFRILNDWAHNISFEKEEIDKERGVIIEEWRGGRGAQARIRDKQIQVILKDSRYAERIPIGKKEIIESFKYETIKKFYKDWYRPDLMAVIAVGDFNAKEIEKFVKKLFSQIPAVKNPKPRKIFNVPEFKETLYSIATDKELSISNASIAYKKKSYSTETVKDLKEDILASLFAGMMGDRLEEIRLKADAPFLRAGIGEGGRLVRPVSPAMVNVVPKDNNIVKGLTAALVELERAKKFGFTETELERQKKEYLTVLEENVKEKDKKESAGLIDRLIENFTTGETFPSEETSFELGNKIVPTITLNDLNEYIKRTFADNNRVVTAALPEKEDVAKPTKEQLEKAILDAGKEKIEAYVDKTLNEDLIPFELKPGSVVSEKKNDKTGVTELLLSNGAKVLLKQTDFKNDEILYTAYSEGGSSLYDDKDDLSCLQASTFIGQAGIGKFTQAELSKYLTGKIVSISPKIDLYSENMGGRSSVKDFETLLKLNYLYFTQPRKDSSVFKSIMSMSQNMLKNKSANPENVFNDTLTVTMFNHNKRRLPASLERLKEIDYDKSLQLYKERFADAGDFTFMFVGSINYTDFKPLIEKYIASLPSLNKKEKMKDVGLNYVKGAINKEVKKGIEQKSSVQLFFTGDFEWSKKEAYIFSSLKEVMEIKLREAIREEKGGTYGVSVQSGVSHLPKGNYLFNIGFGCKPERVEELYKEVLVQIDSVINYPVKEVYIKKVKETQLKSMEKALKENSAWLNWIYNSVKENTPLEDIFNYQERVNSLSTATIQNAAKKYFDKNNFVKAVLYPEK